MQQRKSEILAKRAKLAELKRQRELRQKDLQHRMSSGESSDVYERHTPELCGLFKP
jgi:dynein intermediate chain